MKTYRVLLMTVWCLAAVPLQAAEGVPETGMMRTFAILGVIIVLLLGAAWAMKQYGPVARVRRTLGLEIKGQLALSPKAHLVMVKVGDDVLLLGVTAANITLIKDMGPMDFTAEMEALGLPQGPQS